MRRTTLRNELCHAGILWVAVLAFFLFAAEGAVMAQAAPASATIGGVSPEEAMRLGEKMYRFGLLPSGKPMQGMVQGDVPVDGTMFTCVSCHLRSGVGSTEGQVWTPPIDGARLYAPVSKFRAVPLLGQPVGKPVENMLRPAYTDQTLARVMEEGLDPGDRQLNPVMPVYALDKPDMEIMVYYLKNLSVGLQPGITDTTLRFATVISEEVPKEDREAMLGAVQNFIRNWRVPNSRMERTIKTISHRQEGTARDLRTLALSVWELKGPPETWRPQLEEYYRKEPAFALLGGISTRDWSPIHRFCEERKLPAVFPVTDFPVISESDWYTFYLSKGLSQEGSAAAKYLHGRDELAKEGVIQVFRDEPSGLALSKAFQETWVGLGHKAPATIVLKANEAIPAGLWKKTGSLHKKAVVLLWLNAGDFPDLGNLAKEGPKPAVVMASATLLGKKLYSLPEAERGDVYLTYPYALPQESKGYRAPTATPLASDKIPISHREPALKMHALFQTVSGPLSRLRAFVYRDYFLEMIESLPDLAPGSLIYPRLSFGQGQRYASKGCYVVQLGTGPKPELVKRSEWVIH